MVWSELLSDIVVNDFQGDSTSNVDLLFEDKPISFFEMFVPELFYKKLSVETNRNAEQKMIEKSGKLDDNWKRVTREEIKVFLYINFMFGIHDLPSMRMYWSTDPLLQVTAVSDAMSRNRYFQINQYLHVNDSSLHVPRGNDGHDPMHKVRPLLDLVLINSQENFTPEALISVDEAMIAFKGRLYFKQYIKGKPTEWGIKVWCAADPITGYLVNFSFYTGKSNEVAEGGQGYNVVMSLTEPYHNTFRQVFSDNFFTSIKLAKDLLLKDTYFCGTIRTNRKGWPDQLKGKKKKTVGETKMLQQGNLVACQWTDKRVVNILSTNTNPAMGTAERHTKTGPVQRDIPLPILSYNKGMGGVDKNDQLSSYFPIGLSPRSGGDALSGI